MQPIKRSFTILFRRSGAANCGRPNAELKIKEENYMNVSTFTLEQLGIGAGTFTRAVASGLTDANLLASMTSDQLQSQGFTPRQIEDVSRCLGLIGLSLVVTESHDESADFIPDEGCISPPLQKNFSQVGESHREKSESGPIGELVDNYIDPSEIFDWRVREEPEAQRASLRTGTDSERATTAADKTHCGLTRAHPRVAQLKESVTMTVSDAAFLYGVSKDVIYDTCQKNPNTIPHKRLGKRIRIITAMVFAELGLD